MSEVVIRLKRLGTKKRPHSRIVVIEKRRSRDGKAIEELGYYDPSQQPPLIKLNMDRAKAWLSQGAKASPTVLQLMKKVGGPT